jgi:LmbE family N-acetylglucosaminyl deacetylase
MSITSAIVKMAAPLPRIEEYERFLFIGPHPDDIEVGAGATAAKLAAAGKEICFLICTDGRFGDEYAPAGTDGDALAGIRRQEAIESAQLLGVRDVRFLNLSDGGFYSEEELIRGMAREIGDFQPEVIFCTDPDVPSECHADHLRVGRAAKQLAFFAPFAKIMEGYGAGAAQVKALAMYMTAHPNRYVKTNRFFKKQLEALFTCFPSQYPKENPASASVALYLKLRAREYGLRHLCAAAEGFRVLGPTQMHCLPESGR